MSHSRKVSYRAGLFNPASLSSADKIEAALNEFGAVINEMNHAQVLEGLLEENHVVELVISGTSEEIPLSDWILHDFPTDAKNLSTTFTHKLLSKLSSFFLFYSSATDEETSTLLRSHHKTVTLAPDVLQILFAMTFFENEDGRKVDGARRPASPLKKKVKAKSSQREAKHASRATRSQAVVDNKPFVDMGLEVPTTREQADRVCANLMNRLESILQVYLTGIRRPEVFACISACFIPQDLPEELRAVTEHSLTDNPHSEPTPPAPTDEDDASFFPIQPMRSALYFDSPESFGKWRILLGSDAQRDIRELHQGDQTSFRIIRKKLEELSHGFFSFDNQKRLSGPSTEVPVFEAKTSKNLRIIYQVDVVVDYDNTSTIQVLRVFGVYNHQRMDQNRLWKTVSAYLSTARNEEYRKRCIFRKKHQGGGNIYLPKTWSDTASNNDEEPQRPVDREVVPSLPAEDVNQLHHIISLEKYVTLSKELLDSIEADREAVFPFEVSKHERTVIQHPHSSYVLGRSGTGKTTTILHKMLVIEREWQLHQLEQPTPHRGFGTDVNPPSPRPRQMFVTQSRVLAGKVEEHFLSYYSSLSFASHLHDDVDRVKRRLRGGGSKGEVQEEVLFNEEDNAKWRNDLPARFSELLDSHFPLFITFDRLCAMVEADIEHARVAADDAFSGVSFIDQDSLLQDAGLGPSATGRKGRLVNYDRFLAEYWPHFSQSVKKGLYPSLIYNEIMGVISGSEGTVLSPRGFLDREEYLKVALSEHRDRIYELFLTYRKIKNTLDDYDVTDRTHSIIRAYLCNPSMFRKVDHLYVDETQDNLIIDALLLRMLCRNANGLFWAGDTAQTISAGSSFRFNDLKAFLYRIEKKRARDAHEYTLANMGIKPQEPKMFFLSVNYRSHAGIVDCAHSIIEVIMKHWEKAIDVLPRERGNVDGSKPIFYRNVSSDFVRKGYFLSRNPDRHDKIELGAHQCILVRNEAAKARFIQDIGKIGIILTLYDSKGLEFNDVFVYNFFHDSGADASQWRVVLNQIQRGQEDPLLAAPVFDPNKHAEICSELKCLYVAVTRARNTFRIADESLKGEPMRALWESKGQIMSCEPGADISDFAKASGEKEWADRAKQFFDVGQYLLAKESYEKAGKHQMAAAADAYHLREVALRLPAQKAKDTSRELAFTSAAEAFASCARNTDRPDAKRRYLALSAKCYQDANRLLLAAQTYQLAECFKESAILYRQMGKFDDVSNIISKFGTHIDSDSLESLRDVTRLYYVSRKDFSKAHELFETVEEEIVYLEDRSLDLAQVDLLLLHGRKSDAAELHLAEGRLFEAIDMFLDDTEDTRTSMSKAKACILQALWQLLPFGMIPVDCNNVWDLLLRSYALEDSILDENDQDELAMFDAILSGRTTHLSQLALSFSSRGNIEAALLCLDHFFKHIPLLLNMDIDKTAQELRRFFDYVHILHDFAFLVDPSSNPKIWKLFGIKPGDVEGTVILTQESILDLHAQSSHPRRKDTLTLEKDKFLDTFRGCLRDRLLDRVTRQNDACRKAPALFPCMRHVVYRDCVGTCPSPHIAPDHIWYRHWVDAHLLQILIYHSISHIQFRSQMQSDRRFWVVKLYEALNPGHHHFGSTSNMMNARSVVDQRMAFNVLIDWVRALSFSLEFHPEHQFLTIVMQTADFAFTFDKKEASVYMYRPNFAIAPSCPPQFLRREQGENSLQELLMAFNQKGPTSVLMGVYFIRHVTDESIPVNINAFCTFIERICSSLLVFNRFRWSKSFHSIVLPRSWLKAVLNNFDPVDAETQISNCFWVLLTPLEGLLRALHFSNPGARLFFGPEFLNLERQGARIRNVYIARICRVLGLLATNISYEPFRNEIHAIFKRLRNDADYGFSRLFVGYVIAEDFHDILKTTRRSLRGSAFDEMVQVMDSDRIIGPVHGIIGLRRIIYTGIDDLVSLLEPSDADPSASSTVVASGGPVGRMTVDGKVTEDEEDDTGGHLEHEAEFAEAAAASQNLIFKTEIPLGIYIGHSEEEVGAALVVQKARQKLLDARRSLEEPGIAGSTRRYFLLFKAAVPPPATEDAHLYNLLCLGPLPHLLASFVALEGLALKKKATLKKRLRDLKHEELDEVGFNMTRINALLKTIKRHCQLLGPGASDHEKQDVDQLKSRVKEALDVAKGVQALLRLSDELRCNLELARKGILQTKADQHPWKATSKKDKRPQLVMEDLEQMLDGTWENKLDDEFES